LDAFHALPPSNAPIATQATEPDEEEEEMDDDDDDDLIQSDLTTPAVVENPTLYCSKIQPSLRALLFLLYTQRHTEHATGRFFSVLMRYVVLSSYGINKQWLASDVITQIIAALLFTGRLTLYSEMRIGAGTNTDFHFRKLVVIYARGLFVDFYTVRSRASNNIFKKRLDLLCRNSTFSNADYLPSSPPTKRYFALTLWTRPGRQL
jgi:hypothetical protein